MRPELLYGTTTIRPVWSAVIQSSGGSWWHLDPFEFVLVAGIVGILGGLGYISYLHHQAPGFELKKADWVCGSAHAETVTTYQDMGGGKTIMLVPITTTSTVCDQWVRK